MKVKILVAAIVDEKRGKLVVASPSAVTASFGIIQVKPLMIHEWLSGKMLLIFVTLMIRITF